MYLFRQTSILTGVNAYRRDINRVMVAVFKPLNQEYQTVLELKFEISTSWIELQEAEISLQTKECDPMKGFFKQISSPLKQ